MKMRKPRAKMIRQPGQENIPEEIDVQETISIDNPYGDH
jgi:hypothetical protein